MISRSILLLLACLFMALAAPCWAQDAPGPQGNQTAKDAPTEEKAGPSKGKPPSKELETVKKNQWYVGKVRIKGLGELSEKKVKAILWMQPSSIKPWVKNEVFKKSKLNDDLDNIKIYLANEGFYEARVTHEIQEKPKSRKVNITYTVSKGPATHISGVTIQGLDSLAPALARELSKTVKQKAGQRLRVAPYRTAKQLLGYRLRNQGYPQAKVEGAIQINKKTRLAAVEFQIQPGPRVYFGPVSIVGLERTSPVILRARLLFQEGDPYSLAKIYESQKYIFSLGAFSTVFIQPSRPGPYQEGERVPLEISGTYRKARSVKLGVGYGTEDKLRLQASWKHRNLSSMVESVELSAKSSDILQRLEFNFKRPYFFRADQQINNSLSVNRENETSYTNRTLVNELLLSRSIGKHYHFHTGPILEIGDPEEITADDPSSILEEHKYFISSWRFSGDRDTRAPVFNPEKGSLLQASVTCASSMLGSDIDYLNLRLEGIRLQQIKGPLILAGKLKWATIQPIENTNFIPIFKRYFSGGSQSVRGYDYQELGPQDQNGTPLGGQTLWEGSLELRFPIWENLGGVVFSDAGAVLKDSFAWDTREIRYTAGCGLRYKTPVGPIRLDWGYQLNPQDPDDNTPYRFYFSIGQAF